MKNRVLFAFMLAVLAGCATELSNDVVEVLPVSDVFTATIENPDTKVFVDGALKTHWNEGDEISIFTTTYNQHFKFDGQTGDDEGTFTELSNQFFTGGEIPTVYAVYPYNENTSVTSEGVITMNLPAVQNYAENSFGLGANTMVAVTESNTATMLNFKNLCGYVVVRLYGNATIKSVTLTGNNGEKLSGQATVAPVYGQAPAVMMSESAGTSITLDCGEGVEIGNTAGDATDFWFVVPPVTFTQGFTIRVTNHWGYSMEKTTHIERTVVRNVKNPLSALEVTEFSIAPEGNIVFEDASFKAYCVENFDKDGDKEISYQEALQIESVDLTTDNVVSLKGIEYFKHLTKLQCSGTRTQSGECLGRLKALDVSNNYELQILSCSNNLLSSLELSNNIVLSELRCSRNSLSRLDVSNNTGLSYLACSGNQLTSLDIKYNDALITLHCFDNLLSSLSIGDKTSLTQLNCYNNRLVSLDVSNCKNLTTLRCYENNLSTLNVGAVATLNMIDCSSNNLSALDVNGCKALGTLWCYDNELNELGLSNNVNLSQLNCSNNQLKKLDLSNNVNLSHLNCSNNQLEELDIKNNTNLCDLYCSNNNLTKLDCFIDSWHYYPLGVIDCSSNQLDSLKVADCAMLTTFDFSNNKDLKYLNSSNCYNLETLDVKDCTSLQYLNCYNNKLSSVDVSNNPYLTYLSCGYNQISTLDISANTALTSLNCNSCSLSTLEVSNNKALTYLNCGANNLSTLDVGNNVALTELYCYNNNLTLLDVNNNPMLTRIHCYSNQLQSLITNNNPLLKRLSCQSNLLSTLDVSNNLELTTLSCYDNPYLTEIWLRTGQTITSFKYDEYIATIKYKD